MWKSKWNPAIGRFTFPFLSVFILHIFNLSFQQNRIECVIQNWIATKTKVKRQPKQTLTSWTFHLLYLPCRYNPALPAPSLSAAPNHFNNKIFLLKYAIKFPAESKSLMFNLNLLCKTAAMGVCECLRKLKPNGECLLPIDSWGHFHDHMRANNTPQRTRQMHVGAAP